MTAESAAMVGTVQDYPGLAVVDTACNKTVHGRPWREHMEESLLQIDPRLRPRMLPATGTIHGIGARCKVKHKYVFPIGIAGICGEIESLEVEGMDVPLLISRSHQCDLDIIINVKENTVDIKKLEIQNLPLHSTESSRH